MQSSHHLVGALKALLAGNQAVVDVLAMSYGFTIQVAKTSDVAALRAQHPRYRGLPVVVEVATGRRLYFFKTSVMYTHVEQSDHERLVEASAGVFKVVANCAANGVEWTGRLFVVEAERALGCIHITTGKTPFDIFQAAEHAAMSYAHRAMAVVQR